MTDFSEPLSEPQGVIAIATSPTGHVVAVAHDFGLGGAAGFKQHKRQIMVARARLYRAIVHAYCSSALTGALDEYTIERVAQDLFSEKGGHRITWRAIGYPDEIAEEIERR
jgi:hypothetical protein